MPRADVMPPVLAAEHPVPCRTNPLGVKGVGEAGTIGSTPATVSAVIDALRPLGITSLDMPLWAEKVWSAIQQAKKNQGGSR